MLTTVYNSFSEFWKCISHCNGKSREVLCVFGGGGGVIFGFFSRKGSKALKLVIM